MSFTSVLAGVRLSVLLSLLAHTQAIGINFFSSLKPIPSSSEHIDLQSCTHSSHSSWCFCLRASPSHYFYIGHSVLTADANHASCKCISKALSLWCFTHRKITANPSCSIHSRSWFNFTASQKCENFSKSTCIFNPSPCSLFTSEKRSVISWAQRTIVPHKKYRININHDLQSLLPLAMIISDLLSGRGPAGCIFKIAIPVGGPRGGQKHLWRFCLWHCLLAFLPLCLSQEDYVCLLDFW